MGSRVNASLEHLFLAFENSYVNWIFYGAKGCFYRDDELATAKEVLVKAVQQCFRDIDAEADVPRLPRRQGDNKIKQTVDDILKLFTFMDERKLRDNLPMFVAGNLS